jgi:hypothetical protein
MGSSKSEKCSCHAMNLRESSENTTKAPPPHHPQNPPSRGLSEYRLSHSKIDIGDRNRRNHPMEHLKTLFSPASPEKAGPPDITSLPPRPLTRVFNSTFMTGAR